MKWSRRSLTVQLGALIACLGVCVFSAVGFYLHHALARQLLERADSELIERVAQVGHLLEETPAMADVGADPHRFLDTVDSRHGLLLVIQDPGGRILLSNTDERILSTMGGSIIHGAAHSGPALATAALSEGGDARLAVATSAVGRSGATVTIVVGRSAQDRNAVLRAYRGKVILAAFVGAAITAALGFWLVRQGLGKVLALAGQARQVTANDLAVRLDAAAAPEELRVLATAFNDVLDRLEASFRNLSQFADDLAHDLRTPLNNLMIQTEVLLAQPRSAEEYEQVLASNYEEVKRLARMVDSMLFLARADHAQVALATERLDVRSELERIAEYFDGPASDAGIVLHVCATGEVLADVQLLRRAVSNLVGNALRYTARDGVITIEGSQGVDTTTISVTNPGDGIDAADMPRLFERFYRADKSRSSNASSAGLGLAIVRSIMTLHGGRVSVESPGHRLTRFSLFFPKRNGNG